MRSALPVCVKQKSQTHRVEKTNDYFVKDVFRDELPIGVKCSRDVCVNATGC